MSVNIDPQALRKDCRYSEGHEWARREGEAVLIGVTAFAISHMKRIEDLRFLVRKGQNLRVGQPILGVQCHKVSFDVTSPLSGRVLRKNHALAKDPELLYEDGYGAGWLIALAVLDAGEFDALLEPSAYARWLPSAPPLIVD